MKKLSVDHKAICQNFFNRIYLGMKAQGFNLSYDTGDSKPKYKIDNRMCPIGHIMHNYTPQCEDRIISTWQSNSQGNRTLINSAGLSNSLQELDTRLVGSDGMVYPIVDLPKEIVSFLLDIQGFHDDLVFKLERTRHEYKQDAKVWGDAIKRGLLEPLTEDPQLERKYAIDMEQALLSYAVNRGLEIPAQ